MPMPADPPEDGSLPPVLDPRQLGRIEGVHRGFFYQHLYAVELLLGAPANGARSIAVERDEDVELRKDGETHYIQVKTRQALLQPNDIEGALETFSALRKAHAVGEREGAALFAIISNAEPSPALLTRLAAADWPGDVEIVTPARPSAHGLPTPAATKEEALANCETAAALVPFGGLPPATLTLKLAAIVQHRSAGAADHRFDVDTLPGLFEQIILQLQDFPSPSSPYHPQQNEPPIASEQRVRLIVGFSGAGKTSWAAEAARHRSEPIAYFDVAGLPSAAIATNLARELVARFVGQAGQAPRLPPGLGLDLLRAADRILTDQGTHPLVVIDNAHELSADDLRRIVEAAPGASFLAMARPWPERAIAEASLGIEAERLEGYDPDAVAAVFAAARVGIEHEDALAVLSVTGGLPLFVANAAQLTADHFGGDAEAFVVSVRAQTSTVDTAQALILERSFSALAPATQDAAALLGACDVPISEEEARALLEGIGDAARIASALRELRRSSMLISYAQGISLHDAVRDLAAARALHLGDEAVTQALTRLHPLLLASLARGQDIPRLTFMIRLLPRLGQTDALVDLATSEMFYEQGNQAAMLETVQAAASNTAASPRDQFWAMDALAYWQSRDGGTPDRELVARMAALVDANPEFEDRERLNLLFKQMTIAGTDGDRREIERLSAIGRRLTRGKQMESRIFRHNRAVALYRTGAFDAVRAAIEPLIDEMFESLGFREQALIGANGPALLRLLKGADVDEVKRTADILALWCSAVAKSGHFPGLRRVQAAKLFSVTAAGRSAVNSAMDGADEMLEFMADADGARQFLEQHALPQIMQYGLTDLLLGARGFYAVTLAYCGDFEQADREIAALRNFGGNPFRLQEFAVQAALVERIRSGELTLEHKRQKRGMHLVFDPNRIGKEIGPDDPCACGSGRKRKRCHPKRKR